MTVESFAFDGFTKGNVALVMLMFFLHFITFLFTH